MKKRSIIRMDMESSTTRAGKISYAVVLWLLGAPGFLILIALLARGCF